MPSDGLSSIPQPRSRYTKAECIGRGASKVVYKAFDEVEGIEVAWNEVICSDACLGSGKERTRMLGEITMLQQLKHRNIMRLYDWWFDKQHQVLVFITELLTDGSLRRFIRRKHSAGITLSALKRYAWQILQGLVYLHGHYPAIIHRDLKCDNIFVNGASGELKLGDLGFATLLRSMSAPLSVIGTPEFMAPELYDEHYDEKVDIYSFGMCLLELATLQYPYSECTNPAQIYRKVTRGIPPAALAEVQNTAVRGLIELTINPEPRQRPEARQLLVHPFFADVVQAIRAKGWAKGPAPALGAAAAAAAAASGPRGAAQAAAQAAAAAAATGVPANNEVLLAPAGLVAGGAHRVPLSEPDGGLAAIAAAAEAAAAAAAAGGDAGSGSMSPAVAGMLHSGGSEPVVANGGHAVSAAADGQLHLDAAGSSAASAELALPQSWPKDSSGVSSLLLHASMMADIAQQSDQQQAGSSSSSGRAAADVSSIHQSQQQGRDQQHSKQQQQQLQEQLSSDVSYPEVATTSISWPPQEASTAAIAAIPRTSSSCTCSCTTTIMHSPFEAVSQCSFASNSSWGSGRGRHAGSSSSSVDVAGHAAAAAAHWRQQRGRAPSLDEMSEEDVLFDADSQGTHTEEDCDSEHEDGTSPKSQTISGVWQNIHHHTPQGHAHGKQHAHAQQQPQPHQQQQRYLDPIHEDGDDDDVDCVCRQIDQQQLSFNVGFFNTTGMRKRVGFQYNADEDTVEDVTMEMLENLSLMPQQANAIAEKIKAALEVLGLPHNGRTAAAAVAAAAAASSGGSTPHSQVTGESAAIAIVATAAASAAIESCGTPQPAGSVDLDATGAASVSSGTPCSFGLLGVVEAAGTPSAAGLSPGSRTGSGGLAAGAAVPGSSPGSSSGFLGAMNGLGVAANGSAALGAGAAGGVLEQLACTQQLVRELSMLDKEAGTALLQNLQEELLVQSLAMPEAAAAVGVELGVSLSGQGPTPDDVAP